jgi:transaldolase
VIAAVFPRKMVKGVSTNPSLRLPAAG